MSEFKLDIAQAIQKVELAHQVYLNKTQKQKSRPIDKIKKVGEILISRKEEFAKVITSEMGKPVFEAIAEIEKSALNCNFYIENVDQFLADRTYETERYNAIVRYEPLGVILGVMPWNFPFWQVFRFAVPTILAGNTVVVKHASNVPKSAQLIEEIFLEAGFEAGEYQNLPLDSQHIPSIIEHPYIKAVSLTGSEKAGSSVASVAAKEIKKSVLELGGSNAFIILDDADITRTVDIAINSRMRNAGQSCIAGKRFLIQEGIYDEFLAKFKQKVADLVVGDPFDPKTQIGPLARVDLAEELEKQVQDSIKLGAQVELGGVRKEAYYWPTILTNITDEMPVFKEETFGPVAVIRKIKDFEEAVKLSNQTTFGLGVSVFTSSVEKYASHAHLFEEGAVFFNELVRSDPALPFGGVKKSGFGRELSMEGIREFTNCKTIFFAK